MRNFEEKMLNDQNRIHLKKITLKFDLKDGVLYLANFDPTKNVRRLFTSPKINLGRKV